MGEGQARAPFSEVNCSLGLSQRRLGCRGWVSMDSSYHQALKRRSRRRSLPMTLRHPLRTSDLVT